jgi:hypothetical protein
MKWETFFNNFKLRYKFDIINEYAANKRKIKKKMYFKDMVRIHTYDTSILKL